MDWLGLAQETFNHTFAVTDLNVGEDALLQADAAHAAGYEAGFAAGNHGFGHEQFGNDFSGGFGSAAPDSSDASS
jgi:hypothetical protein